MSKSEAIRGLIEQAFNDAAYPGDGNIVSHQCWECEEVASQFRGTTWKEWAVRGPASLCMRGGGIFLLSPEAFRYFLPAYLMASFTDRDNYIQDSIISILTIDDSKSELHEFSMLRLGGFTLAQAAAVKSYLRFLIAEDVLINADAVRRALHSLESIYGGDKGAR